MAKKKTIPSAFDDVLSSIGYDNTLSTNEVTNMDTEDSFVDVEPNIDIKEPDVNPSEVKENEVVVENNDTIATTEQVLNKTNDTSSTENTKDTVDNIETDVNPSEDDIAEAQQVGALFDAVAESFGWNINDIDEEHRPVTVDELTTYLREVVEQNSTPDYANDQIAQLDAYVKNGGKFEDFYQIQQKQMDYANLDIHDETNQKAVIKELLRTSGYSEEQINNKIYRYENADLLEEEAEEALSRLQVIKQREAEELQKRQETLRIQQEQQAKTFFTSVTNDINNLTEIRGITIPKEDRRALYDYIFKVDANGLSQYQKDFNKNLSKNLIESAYFTMKADSFISSAKKTGETTAAQKLKQMLRHTSKNHSSFNADEEKQRPAWEIASKFL